MKYSTKKAFHILYIFSSGCILLANCMPSPQNQEVSLDDIFDAAGNDSARYGTNQGTINQSLLDDVFGTNKHNDVDVGNPDVDTDDKYDTCAYYEDHEDDYGYECVPYYNCKDGTIITDGGGLIDIRSGLLDPLTSKCPSYLEVCCRHPDYEDYAIPTRPPVATTRRPPPVVTEPPNPCPGPSCPYRQQCGKRNVGGIGVRIQNLERFAGSTQFGEWPHMCAILNKSNVGGREVNLYVCGASLIAPGVVLTGAHCVNDIKDHSTIKVRCGEWDTQQQIEPQKHVDKYAKYISVHPGFDSKNLEHDLALIHLQDKFELTDHINTICLPDPYQNQDSYFTDHCFATGWGKDKFEGDGEYQVILKQVEMNTVPHGVCEADFRGSRLGKRFELHDSFLCAGGSPGKDTCKGDGGGPLVCPSKTSTGQYEQVGIVAWGLGCGSATPGVYADVSKGLRFIDWATKCVEGRNADYYGFEWDARWAKREYCGYQNRKSDVDASISTIQARMRSINDRSEVRRLRKTLRPLKKELRELKKQLPKYETVISSCSSGFKDYDCSVKDYEEYDYYDDRDVDLSAHQRELAQQNSGNSNATAVTPEPRIGEIE